jgi:hypothetical protein
MGPQLSLAALKEMPLIYKLVFHKIDIKQLFASQPKACRRTTIGKFNNLQNNFCRKSEKLFVPCCSIFGPAPVFSGGDVEVVDIIVLRSYAEVGKGKKNGVDP